MCQVLFKALLVIQINLMITYEVGTIVLIWKLRLGEVAQVAKPINQLTGAVRMQADWLPDLPLPSSPPDVCSVMNKEEMSA